MTGTPLADFSSGSRAATLACSFGVRARLGFAHSDCPNTVSCRLEFLLMTQSAVTPPSARQEPTPTTLHGQTLEDNYRWMRDKESPELLGHLTAENAYTHSVMAPTEQLQAKLYAEMLSHIKETDESVPYRDHSWYYYTRTVEGRQYPIHCRRVASGTEYDEMQPEQLV